MSLLISDKEVFYDASGVQHAFGGTVAAASTMYPLSVKQGDGTYIEDQRQGRRSPPVSVVDGSWSLTLPWPSECSPTTTKWVITRADGTAYSGTVPEGVSGPLTLQNLINTYAWAVVQPTTVAQVLTATGPAGPAPVAAANTVVAGPTSGASAAAAPRLLVSADLPAQLLASPYTYLLYQSAGVYALRDGASGVLEGSGSDVAALLNAVIAAHADGNGAVIAVAPNILPYTFTHPLVSDSDYIRIVAMGGHAEAVKFAMSSTAGSLFTADANTTYGTVVSALTVGAAGSGYPTNGVFLCNLIGGTYTTQATCNVTVTAGAISGVAIVNAGAGIVQPGTTPSVDLTPLGVPTVAGSVTVTLNGVPTGWTAGQSAALLIFGYTRNVQGNILDGITLLGNCFNGTGNLVGKPFDGIWLRGSNNAIMNSHVKQFAQDGIRWDSWDYTGTTQFDNYAFNVYSIQQNRDGMYTGFRISDSEFQAVRVDGLVGSGTKLSRYGFYNQGGENKFQNCHPYGCVQDGFHIDRGTGIQIIGGKSETNGRANVYVQMGGSGSYTDFSMNGVECYGSGPSANDLFMQNVSSPRIVGCTLYSPCAKSINMVSVTKPVFSGNVARTSAASATAFFADSATNYIDMAANNWIASGASGVALDIAGGSCEIVGNALEGSVTLEATSSQNTLALNRITGTVTDTGSSNSFYRNLGYKTEASGTATVLQNTTSITVTHGLAATPTLVTANATSDAGTNHWISGITSTQFVINLHTANAGGNVTFGWRAQVSPG